MVGSGWLKWLCFAVGWQFGGPGLAFMSFAAGYYLEKHWLPNGNPTHHNQGQDYRIALQEIAVLLHAAITHSAEIQQQQWRYIRQEFRKRYGIQEGDALYLLARQTNSTASRIAHAAEKLVSPTQPKFKTSSVLDVLQSSKIQPTLTQAELQNIVDRQRTWP